MARVMKALGYKLPRYSKARDPIFTLATPLHPAEANTASRPSLMPPEEGDEEEEVEEDEEVEVVGDVETSSVACRKVEEKRKEMKVEEAEHLRGKDNRKMKLEKVECVKREQESASEVKEEKKNVKKETAAVESAIKEEKDESKSREQDTVEVKDESKIKEDSAEIEVKEEKEEDKIREQDSEEVNGSQIREQEVKKEKEESKIKAQECVKSKTEKKESKAREQESVEREVKKEEKEEEEENKTREQDNMESAVKKEEEESKIIEQDSVDSEVKEEKKERESSEQDNLENGIKKEERESKESKISEREIENDVKEESKIREQDIEEREVKQKEGSGKLESMESEQREEKEENWKRKFDEVNGGKEENRKRKLDSLERKMKEETEESRNRRLESIEFEVKEEEEEEEEEKRKRKLDSLEKEVKDDTEESMKTRLEGIECEVKEEEEEYRKRKLKSTENEVNEKKEEKRKLESEESRKRKLDSMEIQEKEGNRKRKAENEEMEETAKRKVNSIENEISEEKKDIRKRKLDSMESEVSIEKCEGGTKSKDHTNTKPINGLHITLSVEKFPLCPAQGGSIGVKYLKLDRSDQESDELAKPRDEVKQEVDLLDVADKAEEGGEAGTLSKPDSRDSAGETCNSEGKGDQSLATEELCRVKEEGDHLPTTGNQSDPTEELCCIKEEDVCTSERKGVQLGTTEKISSVRETDKLSTTEERGVCISEGKGDQLPSTATEELSSVGEASGRLDTAEEEMCSPEEKGGQLGATEEVCSIQEERGQLGIVEEEMCCVEEEGDQRGAAEEVCSIEDVDRLSTTEEKEACSSMEEGGQLGTTDEEEDVSSLKETGQPGTTDDEELSSLKEERGQLGTTDEEEGKSEPPDTDEDFHTFDLDPEPWEYAADVDVASPKSSASCCSDSESSEKGEDCQTEDSQMEDSQVEDSQVEDSLVEDSQTEDSDTGESQHQKGEQVDYFKLAYASTNVQMARQGQALLKQNDFYGTGLCIRSCVSHTKTGERGSKGGGGSERLMLKGLQRARNEKRREQCGASSSPQTEEESDVSSLPNHCQAAEALSSSDSECPPCECGGKAAVSSPGGASDKPNSCSRCKNLSVEADTCLSPDLLSVLGSVRVEVSGLGREQLSESQVTDGEAQLLSVNTDPQDASQGEEVVVKANSVLCHSDLDLHPGQVGDGSFLLRTRVVDGIITTTCVEAMAKEAAGNNLVPCVSDSSSCNVPAACSSQGEVTSVSVPCLSLNQKGLMSAVSKPTFYIENSVSKAQVKAITEHLQSQRPGSKFSSELSTAESAELKSIWYQSFCGKNSDSNLSALTVMMEMNECNLGRGLSYVRPSNSEKSSSVILKNICAEAVNDSAAQHRNSTKKLKGSDDENVKCLWFWGFDSSAEGKEKAAAVAEAEAEAVEVVESTPEEDVAAESDDCHPVRRVTRSRTRASCDTANQAPPEEEGFKCHCSGSNPELCRIASLRPSRGKCDEDIQRARDIIRRRRTCNYRRYEPIFEKKLVSLTYERTRAKRKSKFDAPPVTPLVPLATHEEEEEEEDHEGEAKEEEQKASDGEECRERDEKGERKFSPGWYGKGLRKGIKKKTRV